MTLSRRMTLSAVTALLLAACNTEASSGSGGAGSTTVATGDATATASTTGTGAGGSTPACVEDDITVLAPFTGPGYDASKGGIIGTKLDSYVFATTLLVQRPEPAAQTKFLQLATAAMGKANQSDGLVGLMVATSKKCGTARTITVWKSPDAMMTFVMSPEHGAAMAAATEVSTSGTVTSWTGTAEELPPTFQVAMTKLEGVSPAY